ncbi:hypothetical protein GCM10020331_029450 [Ectobacillus funiculus]
MDNVYAQMVEIVKEWDPFGYGSDFYETEAVDVVQIADSFDDADYISRKKFSMFIFMSFEEVVAIEKNASSLQRDC